MFQVCDCSQPGDLQECRPTCELLPAQSLPPTTRCHVAALMLDVTCQPVTNMRLSGDTDDSSAVVKVLPEVSHGLCCL